MDPTAPPAREARPPTAGAGRALLRGWRRARAAHRNLALPYAAFEEDVLALLARSRARLGLSFDEAALEKEVAALHVEDLYLARLCERGDTRAWEAFVERYEPDLRAVLRRDWDAAEAEAVAAEVLSELSLAPSDGRSRTRLGTYDGTGPLWAWLATIGFRAARGRWRRRREMPLEVAGERWAAATEATPDLDDQLELFVGALRTGWEQLEPKERLALGWKHHDGLPQRTIARLLDTSEPTVSRLVNRGVAKLRGALSGLADGGPPSDAALWTRLERALAGFLERSGTLQPPDVE